MITAYHVINPQRHLYIEGAMKPYLIGLILTVAMTAYSQGITNMTDKTEEYLNPGAPIQVKTGQNFTIRMESNPTTGYPHPVLLLIACGAG